MKKIPVVSSDDVIRVLKRVGFEYAPKRGKGSHTAFYRIDYEGRKLLVIVPKRRELPKGTFFYPFWSKPIYQRMILSSS
ncbi:MAG: type II toxin-antitoxin system HicA family toxin [Methanosarcinales archaeon]|nr:type II toxin-antitoxin system HicA family toxin [Methanosarcinales archaeon]